MCGIVGFIDKKRTIKQDDLVKIVTGMLEKVKHRGGDDFGFSLSDNIAIDHTRLSILDTSEKAKQPMENRTAVLSLNGEVYNHEFLRKKVKKEKEFDSHSDTVTLFELLCKFESLEVLSEIRGMFAFSFLDLRKRTLLLALDKYGIKPLYYVDTPEYFAWSSEVKAFSAIPNFRFEFNSTVLSEYLAHTQTPERKLGDEVRTRILGTLVYCATWQQNSAVPPTPSICVTTT